MKTFFLTSTIFTKIFFIYFRTYFTSESYIEFKFLAPLFRIENWTRYFTTIHKESFSLLSSNVAILPQKNMKNFLLLFNTCIIKTLKWILYWIYCAHKKIYQNHAFFSTAGVALLLKNLIRAPLTIF